VGIVTINPTKKSQTTVCGSLIPASLEGRCKRTTSLGGRSIRALAVDPTAVPLLVRLLTSASEPIIVRLWAGLSLRALTPPAFASIASTMMANVNEDASLRQMCESAFRTSPTLNRRVP